MNNTAEEIAEQEELIATVKAYIGRALETIHRLQDTELPAGIAKDLEALDGNLFELACETEYIQNQF